ncbi:hypothetical protein KJ359_002154 [Pestalotiopsis sp. 9143b]|nr:hypothetical protein KJ359_002154 [Pestalotiopsis sp. 9143b]
MSAVTAADLFTACYTTILGTAVVIDSKRKGARRAELDAKLERARASLSTLAVQEAPIAYEVDEAQTSWDHGRSTLPTTLYTDGGVAKDASVLLQELADTASTCAPRSQSTLPLHQINWEQVEAAISIEEQDTEILMRHPGKERQLVKSTRTIESLVQDLLWRARSSTSNGESVDEQSKGDELLNEAESLLGEFPSYHNPQVEPRVASEARRLLSESFRTILSKTTDVKAAVGKICYNLLYSSWHPNIHNFNTLIAGFNRIDRPDLAEAVIDHYLASTDWPATQQTVVCLLTHAAASNDVALFREMNDRMRGCVGDGTHRQRYFRRPDDVLPNPETGKFPRKFTRKDFYTKKFTHVRRFDRGPEVFDTLVQGWLKLGDIQSASRAFMACLRSQILPPVDTILELLTASFKSLNQSNARYLVNNLLRQTKRVELLLQYILFRSTAQIACQIGELIYSLFILGDCDKTPYYRQDGQKLKQLVSSLRSSADSQITSLLSDFESISKTAAVVWEYQRIEERTKMVEARAKVLTIQVRTGYDLDVYDTLSRDGPERYPRKDSSALYRALGAIDIGPKALTRNEIRRQLLFGMSDQDVARDIYYHAADNLDTLSIQSLVNFYDPRRKTSAARIKSSSGVVGQVEEWAHEIEDSLKAILFSYASYDEQKRCTHLYENWHEIPVQELFEHANERLERQIWKQQLKTQRQQQHARAVINCNERLMGKTSDRSAVAAQTVQWEDEYPAPHRYVDTPLSVAKSASTELLTSDHIPWSHGARAQPGQQMY